jgi:hypothetical protein
MAGPQQVTGLLEGDAAGKLLDVVAADDEDTVRAINMP